MNTELSIIIPSYNTIDLTLKCLDLIQLYPPSAPYDVIVVDNHSIDGTVESVKQRQYPRVTVIAHDKNLGFSRACNHGAAIARGRYFLFLNSDTETREGVFDRLLRWLNEHPKTGIVGPELIGPEGQIFQMSWGWNPLLFSELIQQFFAPYTVRRSRFKQRLIHYLQRKSREVPCICGACLMIRREAFEGIRGFDEDFELYFEDSDLCFRCVKAGWTIDFLNETRMIHHLGRSTRGVWNKTSLIYQQSHIAFYRKHAPAWAPALLKFYLLYKWLRLRYVSFRESAQRNLSVPYCRNYLRMILERQKFELDESPEA